MKNSSTALLLSALFLLSSLSGNVQLKKISSSRLRLISINQIRLPDGYTRYDLSGMSIDHIGNILTIDDFSNNICKIDTISDGMWKLVIDKKVGNIVPKSNFEALDIKNGHTYLASEKPPYFLAELIDENLKELPVNRDKISSLVGIQNSGIEAIAFDSSSGKMYFCDEASQLKNGLYHDPVIYSTFLNGPKTPVSTFVKYSQADDISDMAIYKSNLYILKRYSCSIEKWDLASKKLIDCYSFRSLIFSNERQELYGTGYVGLAESLLLVGNKIFVGLDNNGSKLNVNFFTNNKSAIKVELNINDIHLDSSRFRATNEPMVFVFKIDESL